MVILLNRILFVTRDTKAKNALIDYLKSSNDKIIDVALGAPDAKEKLAASAYDIIMINYPIDSHTDASFAIECTQTTASGVIALLKNKEIESLAERLEGHGIIVASKPVSRLVLNQAIKFAILSKNRVSHISEENTKLHVQIEQIKLVNRAKWVLVKYLNMSEDQAHKYIEQQAMDRRISKKKIAEKILKTYEH
ncbi:MAG: ANTAR domain-containing response regulator [Anaerovoracaceae bacterium]